VVNPFTASWLNVIVVPFVPAVILSPPAIVAIVVNDPPFGITLIALLSTEKV